MCKLTQIQLLALKQKQEKITCLTAYDASFATQIDAAGVEVVLVGDSLGMVVKGYDSTLPVTMADMLYHTKIVSHVLKRAMLIADMPFMSYTSPQQALDNAGRLIKAGAYMVKLEGGDEQLETVKLLTKYKIPVCAHLGLQPQSINKLGSYKVQGRDEKAAQKMFEDALALEEAGADLLVLECVPQKLAARISKHIKIPTIGIGAGSDCDGQVLVLYDLLGISMGKIPKFAKNFLQKTNSIQHALERYIDEVKSGQFPAEEHRFD